MKGFFRFKNILQVYKNLIFLLENIIAHMCEYVNG